MDFALNLYPTSLLLIGLILVVCFLIFKKARPTQKFNLERHSLNPVISPRPHQEWETRGTFNPAALTDSKGEVHLLYRSIGIDGLSNIGHSKSADGYNFKERSAFPVYQPASGTPKADSEKEPATYNPNYYTSGGGWGGFEDPRTVVIDDKVYMTYVNFAGWDSLRIGLTSIPLADLEKGRWNWKRPIMLTPDKQVNKNWSLFPEKINGKFAIIHSISPKILVDYLDDIDDPIIIKEIKSSPNHHGHGYVDKARENYWDNRMKGAGPPPIKTERGWLLLYHAIDQNKYKIGAMLLDLKDPTKVLYRSPSAILEPDVAYENDAKPGVVYATGAIMKGNDLVVYYGGGDKHICVAQTPIKQLPDWLIRYGKV